MNERRSPRDPHPRKYVTTVEGFFAWFIVILLALFALYRCATASDLDVEFERRVMDAPVVLSGHYLCYLIARTPKPHLYCRRCERCVPKFSAPVVVQFDDHYLPRPQ